MHRAHSQLRNMIDWPTPTEDAMTTTIWTLLISNHYGEDTSVHATESGAKAALLEYVRDNWENAAGRDYRTASGQSSTAPDEPPANPEEAINIFYAAAPTSEEWYTLHPKPLNP